MHQLYVQYLHIYIRFVVCVPFIVHVIKFISFIKFPARLVYRWFQFLYNASYGFGIMSYVVMMCVLFGKYCSVMNTVDL